MMALVSGASRRFVGVSVIGPGSLLRSNAHIKLLQIAQDFEISSASVSLSTFKNKTGMLQNVLPRRYFWRGSNANRLFDTAKIDGRHGGAILLINFFATLPGIPRHIFYSFKFSLTASATSA